VRIAAEFSLWAGAGIAVLSSPVRADTVVIPGPSQCAHAYQTGDPHEQWACYCPIHGRDKYYNCPKHAGHCTGGQEGQAPPGPSPQELEKERVDSMNEAYTLGEEAFDRREWDVAAKRFQEALEDSPYNVMLENRIADARAEKALDESRKDHALEALCPRAAQEGDTVLRRSALVATFSSLEEQFSKHAQLCRQPRSEHPQSCRDESVSLAAAERTHAGDREQFNAMVRDLCSGPLVPDGRFAPLHVPHKDKDGREGRYTDQPGDGPAFLVLIGANAKPRAVAYRAGFSVDTDGSATTNRGGRNFKPMTSLSARGTYADANAVPYVALPMGFAAQVGARLGDVVQVTAPNGKTAYGIYADNSSTRKDPMGEPGRRLGEGSLALLRALGYSGKVLNPSAGGLDPGQARFVLFPGSGAALGTTRDGWPTSDQIQAWGGQLAHQLEGDTTEAH
jgi:hypothetical protein